MKRSRKKKPFDAVAVFRRIARAGPSISDIDSDAAWEEEMDDRARRCGILPEKKSEAKG